MEPDSAPRAIVGIMNNIWSSQTATYNAAVMPEPSRALQMTTDMELPGPPGGSSFCFWGTKRL